LPSVELSEGERAALAAFLRDVIATDRYPLSPRWQSIKSARQKLDLPRSTVE
jgi:hypothetical protein